MQTSFALVGLSLSCFACKIYSAFRCCMYLCVCVCAFAVVSILRFRFAMTLWHDSICILSSVHKHFEHFSNSILFIFRYIFRLQLIPYVCHNILDTVLCIKLANCNYLFVYCKLDLPTVDQLFHLRSFHAARLRMRILSVSALCWIGEYFNY